MDFSILARRAPLMAGIDASPGERQQQHELDSAIRREQHTPSCAPGNPPSR
jgi:hypothetical protein